MAGNSIHTKKRTEEERRALWRKARRFLVDGHNYKQAARTLQVTSACLYALRRDFEPSFVAKGGRPTNEPTENEKP